MKINFLVNSLGQNQLAVSLIKSISAMDFKTDMDLVVFTEHLGPHCLPPTFATMQISEAWGQEGAMIATSYSTAQYLLNFPGKPAKLYYVWDLEWLRGPNRVFAWYDYVYANPQLTLVARSQHHADILSNNFNREVKYIVPDCNVPKLIEVINGLSN